MNIGIIGAGNIARTMAKTLQEMEDANGYAIASRSLGKAQAFAKEFEIEKAYGSYEEMLLDPKVDLVYVATPHSHHYEHMKLCMEYKKPVLCEKAFTANADQAEEVLKISEENGIFAGEAMWTRFLPSRKMINEIIQSGEIGTIHMITANLGYEISQVERLRKPELAGGALLDVGIYPLSFIRMVTDEKITEMQTVCTKLETGVDAQNTAFFRFENGCMASMHSSMLGGTEQAGIVYGDKGYLIAWNVNNVNKIQVFDNKKQMMRELMVPKQITGFEYEVRAAMQAIREGKTECPQMPHSETLYMMKQMDSMRKAWGISFPFEEA
nr:Gfo/Idh/MocA family oxidoreductase [uncultured Sellimonas sp.]